MYDLVFEFETKEDMVRFSEVVAQYASAPEESEEEKAVISDSEIMAVYVAEEAEHMLDNANTREIEKIIVENDNGKLELYCLMEDTDTIKEKLEELTEEQEISFVSKKYVCNKAFFFSLGGEDLDGEESTEE